MLLNSTKKLAQLFISQRNQFSHIQRLTNIPLMKFGYEPPQGFKKFDRRRKRNDTKKQDKKEYIDEDEQLQESNKQEQDPQDQKKDKQDEQQPEKSAIEKWKEKIEKEQKRIEDEFKKNLQGFQNNLKGNNDKKGEDLKKNQDNKSEDPEKNENKKNDEDEDSKKENNNKDKDDHNEDHDSENKSHKSKKSKKHHKHKKTDQNQEQQNVLEISIPIRQMLIYGGISFIVFNILYEFLDTASEIDYKLLLNKFILKQQIDLCKRIFRCWDSRYTFHHKIYAVIITKDGDERTLSITSPDNFIENIEIYQRNKGISPQNMINVEYKYSTDVERYFYTIRKYSLSMLIIGFILYTNKYSKNLLQDMKPNMGENVIKEYGIDSKIKIKFADVAGQAEAKLEIMEFVDFLKNPSKYEGLGAKMPKGALLTGPPGTGKTLLAKACAGESGVPFFFMSGSDFVQMYVGVGSSRVRQLFEAAKKKSPSIIFIDEIDAIGRKRDDRGGGDDERSNTLNQLLVEMDGFSTDAKVIVFAATNRKELLDPALVRPGRFDRQIEITNPDINGRKEIFMVHLANLKIDPSKTIDEIAKRLATLTPGFSGADIMNLCNEAAILAARKNKDFVESIDFEMASERVMAGLEKKSNSTDEEKRVIAVHESGHAVCSWFLEGGDPLLKLTIIPRTKGSLGYAQYLPNESSLQTKEELLDRICCILGGRVAEEVFFNQITTGAYDDLQKIQKMVHAIITKYGMSERIGYVGLKEGDYSKSYSDKTNRIVDEEISEMIRIQTERTRELIISKKSEIQRLSDALMEKKTLDLSQIKAILGDRPFSPKSNFKAFLESNEELEKEKQKEIEEKQKENEEKQAQEVVASV